MARPHANFWGWASDHWLLTGLVAIFVVPTVIYMPVAAIQALKPKPLPAGTTPFPPAPPAPPAKV